MVIFLRFKIFLGIKNFSQLLPESSIAWQKSKQLLGHIPDWKVILMGPFFTKVFNFKTEQPNMRKLLVCYSFPNVSLRQHFLNKVVHPREKCWVRTKKGFKFLKISSDYTLLFLDGFVYIQFSIFHETALFTFLRDIFNVLCHHFLEF